MLPFVVSLQLWLNGSLTATSITAAEVAAGREGKYLHQLLPAFAPPRQAEASGVGGAAPGAGTQDQAKAQEGITSVDDLSEQAQKIYKRVVTAGKVPEAVQWVKDKVDEKLITQAECDFIVPLVGTQKKS